MESSGGSFAVADVVAAVAAVAVVAVRNDNAVSVSLKFVLSLTCIRPNMFDNDVVWAVRDGIDQADTQSGAVIEPTG